MDNNLRFQDSSGGYSYYNPSSSPQPQHTYNQQGYRPPNNNPNASSNSILSLVFGIISYLSCPVIFGIIAWVLGKAELNKIKRGESSPASKGFATAGMWLGIINVILFTLILAGYLIMIIILWQKQSSDFEKWLNV